MPIPTPRLHIGQRVAFLLDRLRPYDLAEMRLDVVERLRERVLTLEASLWIDYASRRDGIALRSDDTPIEVLRRIQGWRGA